MTDRRLDRRQFVLAAAALLPRVQPDETVLDFIDHDKFKVELQASNPRIRCFDWRQLDRPQTPASKFFVFHQTAAPRIDPQKWRLEIAGAVERPMSLSLGDILNDADSRLQSEVTIECSGNSPGKEAMNGLVSNAVWSGVRLDRVLNRCGIRPEAREVVFFGADLERDAAANADVPHGRSVFIQDALSPGVLLATHMNGEPLDAEHGYPLRVIFPGWYGMTQIKWLSRIEVIDRRYEGPQMSRNYHSLHAVGSTPESKLLVEMSIARMRMKSVVGRVVRARRGSATLYRMDGAAWGEADSIDRIEVRVDQGGWRPARVTERRGPLGWLLWTLEWTDVTAGRHTLVSRAIDKRGRIQPTLDQLWDELKSARENNAQWEREIEIRL